MAPNCVLRPTIVIFSTGCSSELPITQRSNGWPAVPPIGASGCRIGRRRAMRKRRRPLVARLSFSDFDARSGDDRHNILAARTCPRYLSVISWWCLAGALRAVGRWPIFVVEGLLPEAETGDAGV